MKKFKELRKKSNLNQSSIARHLAVSQKTISSYEVGSRLPSIEQLPKLAETLNCSIEDLVNGLISTRENYKKRNTSN